MDGECLIQFTTTSQRRRQDSSLQNDRRSLRNPGLNIIAALCAMMTLFSGCQTATSLTWKNRTWGLNSQPLDDYESVDLVYEVDHSETGLKKRGRHLTGMLQVSGHDASKATNFENVTGDVSPWCNARVRITYPNPKTNDNTALVTLRLSRLAPGEIETSYFGAFKTLIQKRIRDKEVAFNEQHNTSGSGNTSKLDDEVWSTSLTKEQLDLLIKDITNNGIFDHQERPYSSTELSLKLDSKSINKSWTQEPRLNQLIEHTYQQGQLIGFVSPERIQTTSDNGAQFPGFRGKIRDSLFAKHNSAKNSDDEQSQDGAVLPVGFSQQQSTDY